jgi:hypothetical protein
MINLKLSIYSDINIISDIKLYKEIFKNIILNNDIMKIKAKQIKILYNNNKYNNNHWHINYKDTKLKSDIEKQIFELYSKCGINISQIDYNTILKTILNLKPNIENKKELREKRKNIIN